MIFPWGNEAVE